MKTKKSPNIDLRKKISAFLLAGVAFMLFIAWQTLEYTTTDMQITKINKQCLVDNAPIEEVPITEFKVPAPPAPKPMPVPDLPKVIDKVTTVKNTVENKQPSDNNKTADNLGKEGLEDVPDITEVPTEVGRKPDNVVAVPMNLVTKAPIYPGCDQNDNQALLDCFEEKVRRFVIRRFDKGLASRLGLEGHQKVTVQFSVGPNGEVKDILAKGSHPRLEKEGSRIISKLPQMKPGLIKSKPVEVVYTIPIDFNVR